MTTDPYAEFKAKQRESWAHFAPLEVATIPTAARLVNFARIRSGQKVLDVGCGTGVVAITARLRGATVTGLDLTPELLARAKLNAAVSEADDVTWKEGDVENLPFADATFDVVTSQFGHMFAPRPEVAAKEMLRVLKPGGTIAFSTWPPELFLGKMFALVGKHLPPPQGVPPAGLWGDPNIVRERLGNGVKDVVFDRGTLTFAALSPKHYRDLMEHTSGPVINIVKKLQGEPAKLASFRQEFDELIGLYFTDNTMRQDYLMTRATKA
jgi:SAM-dependent methyltransferase